MGSLTRVKVWSIKSYISTNGTKPAGLSYQIRGGTTQDQKDLPVIIFSPWNCNFLKPHVSQHAVLPNHCHPKASGTRVIYLQKVKGEYIVQKNHLEGDIYDICEHTWQLSSTLIRPCSILPGRAVQPRKVSTEFMGSFWP